MVDGSGQCYKSHMEFRVLGPLQVVDDGRPIELDRRLLRALLAYLLLHANEAVSAERLVDELWGPTAPRTATASLQNYVSRLRKRLGPDRILLGPAGYLLRVDPERFDLARFERLVAEAHVSPAKQRAELLRAALSLWRGEPLEDLAFEEFAQAEIAQLVERRLTAIEARIDAELELGWGGELIDELEALIAANPLREGLRGQLMLALYRAGRQTDALEAYGDVRRLFRDELGLEPGGELRALEQAILRQDPTLFTSQEARGATPDSRRTVTILFCDLVDSARLATTLDPEAYRELISSYVDAVRGAIHAHGGTVEKFIGNAVMAVFGMPKRREDDALRAVRAAVDVRDAVTRMSTEAERALGVRLTAGIALNTGEVVTAPESEGPRVAGAAVNVAAHLAKWAGANEIVLGGGTRALIRDAVRAEPVDLGEDLDAWRLEELIDGAPLQARRFDAPFVGRDEELHRLQAAFERVREKRACAVVTLVGEAGIGKTRLGRELVASLEHEALVLVGRCVSYGAGATYLPLAEIVRQAAADPSVAGIAELLSGEEDAGPVAQRVAELVGFVDGLAAPGEAFWAVRRLLEAVARDRPLVVALDDVHWAEPTLLDLVEYLGKWAEGPILVLCAARSELLEVRPGWGGPTSTGFVLELGPLPLDEVGALVEELAGGLVARDVQERIAERASGNPLFAEQLLAVVEEAPDLSLRQMPQTVEALIASRLDRLEPGELATLRLASVIGRRFSRAEVRDLGPVEDADLLGLERKGLVHGLEPGSVGVFRFHHVLVRDVAYAGIPKAERAELHERAADSVDRLDGADELVGYHLEQAFAYRRELGRVDGRAGLLALAAGERLSRAGIRAWKRGDAPAAANLLGRATTLLPESNESRSELLCELGVAVWATGDASGAKDVLHEAVQTASARGDRRTELRARLECANVRLFHGEEGADDELLYLAATAVMLFEELGDDRSLGRAWLLVSYLQGGLRCQYAASLEAAERARACSIRAGWPASAQQVPAALFYGPTPVGAAITHCEMLLEEADRLGEAMIFIYLGGLWTMKGRFEEGRVLAGRAEEACGELGMAALRGTTLAPVRAEIEMRAGNPSAAEDILRESCSAFERIGERVHLATQSAQLADALYEQGDYDEAERWTRTAEASTSANDVSAQLSWRAVRAKTRARAGSAGEAESLGRAAVELAEQTDALNHRGRVLLDLAEVLRLDDRVDEASTSVEQALSLFERKENDVSAQRARTLLAELAIA
jgi:DNA-binding SARP family transcriptional activator